MKVSKQVIAEAVANALWHDRFSLDVAIRAGKAPYPQDELVDQITSGDRGAVFVHMKDGTWWTLSVAGPFD